MTRIHLLSDLHMDINRNVALPDTPPDCDLILIAGDVLNEAAEGKPHYAANVAEMNRYLSRSPAQKLAVAGNHEPYRSTWPAALSYAHRKWSELGVTLLEQEEARIAIPGVRLFACTLWTNFDYSNRSAEIAAQCLNDFRLIKTFDRKDTVTPVDQYYWNREARGFLAESLGRASGGDDKIIVMTHHSPSLDLTHDRFKGDALNPAFHNSGMEELIEMADLWVFGHTHDATDQTIHGCRCVANPYGYQPAEAGNGFDPLLVLEV